MRLLDPLSRSLAAGIAAAALNVVFASTTAAGTLVVTSGGKLLGVGNINADVVVEPHGTLSAGLGSSPGCLSMTKLTLAQGSVLDANVAGTTPCSQHDQIQVGTLVGEALSAVSTTAINGYVPSLGDEIALVSVGTGQSMNPFASSDSPAETVVVGGVPLSIQGNGGDGNDISLLYRLAPSDPALVSVYVSADGEITVEFDVANTGASPLTSVTVSCTDGTTSFTGQVNGQTAVVSGLNPENSYVCSVTVTNSNGASQSQQSLALVPAQPTRTGLPLWLLIEARKSSG